VISACEDDLAVVARHARDGGRPDSRVDRDEHLGLQPAARAAGAADALAIDLRQALQVVHAADVCPDHVRLVADAQGQVLIVTLGRGEYDVSHLRQDQASPLHLRVGVPAGPVPVRAQHGRGGAVGESLRQEQQAVGVDVRPEPVVHPPHGAPLVVQGLALADVQADAIGHRPQRRAAEQLLSERLLVRPEVVALAHGKLLGLAHRLEVAHEHLGRGAVGEDL